MSKSAANGYLQNYYFSRTLSSSLPSSNQVNHQRKGNWAFFATGIEIGSMMQPTSCKRLPATPCKSFSRLSDPLFRPHHADNIQRHRTTRPFGYDIDNWAMKSTIRMRAGSAMTLATLGLGMISYIGWGWVGDRVTSVEKNTGRYHSLSSGIR
jgi:hypothetical protein